MPIRSFRLHAVMRASAAMLLLSSAACAGRRSSSAPAPSSADAAVAASSRSFEDAVSHGDTVALGALLSDDLVVWRGDDSVSGPAARRLVLASWGPGRSIAELLLVRGERETCPAAAFETGRFTAYEHTSLDSSRSTASGTYGVRWALSSSAAPRIVAVSLDTAAMSRTSQRVVCATAARLHAEHQRVVVMTGLPLNGGGYTTHDGLDNQLAAQGWPGGKLSFCTNYQNTGTGYPPAYNCSHGTGTAGPAVEMIGARIRIFGPVWVEGLRGLMDQTGTSMGFNSSTGSFIVESYQSSESMALVSYEWRHLRVGAGAVRVNAHWDEFSDVLQVTTAGAQRVGPQVRLLSTSSGTGMATQLAYSMQVMPPFSFELVARHRSGVQLDVPAIGPYPQTTAQFNGTSFTAGISVGY